MHAVTVVEASLSTRARVNGLLDLARKWLIGQGIPVAEPAPIEMDRGFIGRAYAVPTPASEAACARLVEVPLEPIYSGKAMAALLAGPARPGERVLFWVTPRRCEPLETAPDWRSRLPLALRRRLGGVDARRRLVVGGLLAAGGVAAGLRLTGYPAWTGRELAGWEAHVLRGAAEALLPPLPGPFDDVPGPVDRYVAVLPASLRRDIHLLLGAIEHGTFLDLRARRFTALDVAARRRYLEALDAAGGMRRQLYRGLRDLCVMARYQQPSTWEDLGYGGPLVAPGRRADAYDALRAPDGAPPRGWT